ncbi:hypothetical protein FOA43_003337 [Brettanomyces nanus]|uniref:Double-strand break repair protein n=1 Tax=Eeniella nana TaxID=13502 RepID=A0A875S2K5_EENNA|nr:uncharacterized protein FOA43_003337 [Brettanomyces nanus]QPG75951.1 hypothetical protein FOA43_003337 [Brettanomyces nanus]
MPLVSNIEPGPDTFRILLTTDNHIGFMENDPIRGDDGWKTFSEILHLAVLKDVDMVIQGGDLFHMNQPSKKAYYHVIQILRECCWNDKPIEFRLISDPSNAMATKHFSYPAEYDNNVNVGIPMYAISGNHDDATGEELLSPLDLLSVGALLNHFGRVTNNDQITVYPLLFNKGTTNLALYGLQNIREERLKRTMASSNLEFLQPDTGTTDVQWFSLMCIHQNHVQRPGIRVVEEINLPDFLDFIFWGHEHDCIPHTVENPSTGFNVLQAGSSIATSLSEGELAEKHVFILNIKGKDFSLEPIALKSVRPFAMKSVVLAETGLSATSSNKAEVLNFLIGQVEQLIKDAIHRWKENNKDEFDSEELTEADVPLPLVRLRVEYSGGYEVENPRYFSNRFVGEVANVNDVLTLYRKKSPTKDLFTAMVKESRAFAKTSSNEQGSESQTGDSNIFGMIENQLNDNDLILIRKDEFSNTLSDLISKDNKVVLDDFVKEEEDKSLELLKKLALTDDEATSKDVSQVKKSFRRLAKRIRVEAEYAGADDITGSTIEPNRAASVEVPLEPMEISDEESLRLTRTSRTTEIREQKAEPKQVKRTTKAKQSHLAPSLFSGLGRRK